MKLTDSSQLLRIKSQKTIQGTPPVPQSRNQENQRKPPETTSLPTQKRKRKEEESCKKEVSSVIKKEVRDLKTQLMRVEESVSKKPVKFCGCAADPSFTPQHNAWIRMGNVPLFDCWNGPTNEAFHDLTSFLPPPNLKSLSGLGLGFIPMPFCPTSIKTLPDDADGGFAHLERSLQLKFFFTGVAQNNPGDCPTWNPKLHVRSEWIPSDKFFPDIMPWRLCNFQVKMAQLFRDKNLVLTAECSWKNVLKGDMKIWFVAQSLVLMVSTKHHERHCDCFETVVCAKTREFPSSWLSLGQSHRQNHRVMPWQSDDIAGHSPKLMSLSKHSRAWDQSHIFIQWNTIDDWPYLQANWNWRNSWLQISSFRETSQQPQAIWGFKFWRKPERVFLQQGSCWSCSSHRVAPKSHLLTHAVVKHKWEESQTMSQSV